MSSGNYIRVDGRDLYYETSGSGFPVVFIHTAGTDGRIWKHFVGKLPDNIKAIVPDLPGHGKSWPWTNWRKTRLDVGFYADAMAKFIRALKLEKVLIVGVSIGADIALMLSNMLEGTAVATVVVEGAARTHTFAEEVILKTEPGNVERAFDFCGRNAKKEYIEDLIWIRSSNNRDIYVTDLLAWNNFDYSKELKSTSTRVYLMRGEDDPVVTENMLDETVKLLKNSSKQTMEGLGHYPMIEDPGAFLRFMKPIFDENIS